MPKYLLRRFAEMLITLFLIATATFFLLEAVPGDPLTERASKLSPTVKENLYKRYGLDKPMMERYVITMKGICKGEFGESVVYAGQTVQKLIHDRLPVSARLGIQQVLAGKVNKDLVAKLRGRGVGLCGMDGQMLRCTELDPQLGHVGEIVHVDPTLISSLLDSGYIPVIATVGMDDLGQAYNVNADTAAAQIAIALKAEKLVSMTDIAGLLRDKEDESTLIPEVEVSEIEGYKSAGIIAGGMIPKIGGMADAIYQGVHEAVIIDGRVPHSILLELFSDRGSGTRFYRRSHHE